MPSTQRSDERTVRSRVSRLNSSQSGRLMDCIHNEACTCETLPPSPSVVPSIVLPLYRSEGTLEPLIQRLVAALGRGNFCIVGVDDDSPDASGDVLCRVARSHGVPCKVVRHASNLGQTAAIVRGLRHASGPATVVMDADLQDCPEVVPLLLGALERDQSEVAFACRRAEDRSLVGRFSSRLFRRLIYRLLGADLPPDVALFLAVTEDTRLCLLGLPIDESLRLTALFALGLAASVVDYDRPGSGESKSGYSFRSRARLGLRVVCRAAGVRWHRRRLREHAAHRNVQ